MRCRLLVRLRVVQPHATEDGPDHASNHQGQTDSPGVQLLVLRRGEEEEEEEEGEEEEEEGEEGEE